MAPSGGSLSSHWALITVLLYTKLLTILAAKDLCSVFEPFKVEPDNAKYKIGGPFPLHEPDCSYLNVNNVQNLVGVQWALSHWNQNPDNLDAKIAMHAGDTCARPQQALAMTLEFLQSGGLLDAVECSDEDNNDKPRILGVMTSSDFDSVQRTASVLSSQSALPLVTYTTDALLALGDHKPLVISSAPHLKHYLQASIKLLESVNSNLVTVVLPFKYQFLTAQITDILSESSITVEATLFPNDADFYDSLVSRKSNITLSCLSSWELKSLIGRIATREQLIVNLPLDGQVMAQQDLQKVLPPGSKLQLVQFQQHMVFFDDFQRYFIGVVRNNYESYNLLAGYMQQVYNCSLVASETYPLCAGVSSEYMSTQFIQAPHIEQVVLATYALTTLGAQIQRQPAVKKSWLVSEPVKR